MQKVIDKGQFLDMFKGRAVLVTSVAPGRNQDLANQANETEGRGDAALRTKAEFSALFDLLTREFDADRSNNGLALLGGDGRPTAAGQAVEGFLKASEGKDEFFEEEMYLVRVTDWPREKLLPDEPVEASGNARLAIWPTDPRDARHIPPPDERGISFLSSTFSLMNSGNRTKYAPKRSWKIDFDLGGDDDRLVGMARLNLKSMVNDPSQMREALAWQLFGQVGIPAARHAYAKLGINERYLGLFSLIEQVDGRFLKDNFGKNDQGNLYKAYCGDVGCATLEHRVGSDGDDSGRQYFTPGHDDLTYRLKTKEDDPTANTYDDLAQLVRTINGRGSFTTYACGTTGPVSNFLPFARRTLEERAVPPSRGCLRHYQSVPESVSSASNAVRSVRH